MGTVKMPEELTQAQSPSKEDPLIVAVLNDDARLLREAGNAAAAAVHSNGKHALVLAADLGHSSSIEALLAVGAVDSLPECHGLWSATQYAAFRGHKEALALLLGQSGGPCLTADSTGLSPLHAAALKGRLDCASMLISAAPKAVHAKDTCGRTALMLAATTGSVNIIRLLAEQGADLDATSNDGKTALHWAVISHQPRAVEALVQLGATTNLADLPAADPIPSPVGNLDMGKTPFEYANARHGKDPILRHVSMYLSSVDEKRQYGTNEPPSMPEMPWVEHARAVVAEAEKVAAAQETAAKVCATGSTASDIWEDDEEEAISKDVRTADTPLAASDVQNAVEGAVMVEGELDELD